MSNPSIPPSDQHVAHDIKKEWEEQAATYEMQSTPTPEMRAAIDTIMDWAAPLRRHPQLAADLRACRAAYRAERTGRLRARDKRDQYIIALLPSWLKWRYAPLWQSAPPLTRWNLDVTLSGAAISGAWYPVAREQLTKHLHGWGDKRVGVTFFANGRNMQPPWRPVSRVELQEGVPWTLLPAPQPQPSPLGPYDASDLAEMPSDQVAHHSVLALHIFDYATLEEARSAFEDAWYEHVQPHRGKVTDPNTWIALAPGLQVGSHGRRDDPVSKMDKDVTLLRLWLRWRRMGCGTAERFADLVSQDDTPERLSATEERFIALFRRARRVMEQGKLSGRVPRSTPPLPERLWWLHDKSRGTITDRLRDARKVLECAANTPSLAQYIQLTHYYTPGIDSGTN